MLRQISRYLNPPELLSFSGAIQVKMIPDNNGCIVRLFEPNEKDQEKGSVVSKNGRRKKKPKKGKFAGRR
jgi:hypothetical protein